MPTHPPAAGRATVWRTSSQLAQAIREARLRLGITQAELAKRARVGMKFLYELESGKDSLRSDKVLDVLDALSLRLVVAPSAAAPAVGEERAEYRVRRQRAAPADYVGMACASAGVSLKTALAPEELIRGLLTGEVPAGRKAHFIVLLEEAPQALLRGLATQVGAWAKPGAVERNLRRIARGLGIARKGLP
jgi:transcriptional regulator with XRE-family HTH domain